MAAPTPSAPFRCQIALQGGGARIVPLMAAMEAVQKLETDGRLTVTRVAGTSAGSIVAAIFAAGIDLAQARRTLSASIARDIHRFRLPSLPGALWKLWARSSPLWDDRLLSDALGKVFDSAGVTSLGDIYRRRNKHIHIVTSVLSDSRKHVYSDEQPDTSVVSALLDSCALPFCFRVWQPSGPVFVDGGLCDNLPSDELLPYESEDGPVLALSFKQHWPGTPRSLAQFSLALLDTAINNGVARAKSRLGLDRYFEIPTTLSTFDFERALALTEQEVSAMSKATDAFASEFISKHKKKLRGNPWTDLNPGMLEEWWRIYESQHLTRPVARNDGSTLIVQANCLVDPGEDLHGAPDFVHYSVRFTAIDEMFCSHLALIPSEGSTDLDSSEVQMFDATGQPVGIALIPARDPKNVGKRPALVYFTPPLRPSSGPYTLKLSQNVPAFMTPLCKQGHDELYVRTKNSKELVGRVDLVLHVPKRHETARLLAQTGGAGRAMTPDELIAYQTPAGFRTLGWRGEALRPDTKFGCDVCL